MASLWVQAPHEGLWNVGRGADPKLSHQPLGAGLHQVSTAGPGEVGHL